MKRIHMLKNRGFLLKARLQESRLGKIACSVSVAFLFALAAADVRGINARPDLVGTSAIVSNLRAEFRHGQVFLTWDEVSANDQDIRVYISREPITKRSLSGARLLTDRLEPHSANDWYDDPDECPRARGPVHGWIIEAATGPLGRHGGLFVHTVAHEDPGLAYFAVLAKHENQNSLKAGVNTLQTAVAIKPEPIQAIRQVTGEDRHTSLGKPLVLSLHSHQSRPKDTLTHLFFGDHTMGWREGLPFKFKVTVRPDVVLLEPYDRVWINRKMSFAEARANGGYDTLSKNIESWWYGTNDQIHDPKRVADGTPTNYTERWLMWVINWVQENYKTDPDRVYAFGASMGTGILRIVLRNPEKFASVDLLVPILDPFGEGNVGERMAPRVGGPERICSDGIKLNERLNTVHSIETSRAEPPPMVIRVGRTDKSVTWPRKPVFMRTVQENKLGLFAAWDNGGHGDAVRNSFEGFPDWFNFKWHADRFSRKMSYPVLSNCSLDGDPGNGDPEDGDVAGFINRGFLWKVIEDKKFWYQVLLTLEQPSVSYPVYADVTPRRCQEFKSIGEQVVEAYNIDADGKIIEKKILKVNNGLVTYDRFTITSSRGNTLVLSREAK